MRASRADLHICLCLLLGAVATAGAGRPDMPYTTWTGDRGMCSSDSITDVSRRR